MIAFLKANIRWIGGGFLLTYASSFGQTFFISASVGEWQDIHGLSHGGFGAIYMIATLGSALTLPFLGKLVDTVSETRLIAVCIPALAAAMILAAYAPNVLLLVFSIYLLRLFGQGMMTHVALTSTGRWFAASRGRAVSLVVLGHQGGEASLPLLFAAITIAAGYQFGWIAGAAFLMIFALPLAIWAFAKPRTPEGETSVSAKVRRQWTRAEVVRDPVFWLLLTGVLAPPFIGTTIFFHQDYMTSMRSWSPQAFPTGLTLMAATTVIFALIAGALIDRFGARRILPFFLLPLAISCFVAGTVSGPIAVLLFMPMLGVSYGFSSTLFGSLWPDIYGTEHLGAVRSLTVAIMVFATAAGPGLTGGLIDIGVSYPTQLITMGLYCLFGIILMTIASHLLARRVAE